METKSNQQPCKVLLVGVGGYGGLYVKAALSNPLAQVVGVVDPFAKTSQAYPQIAHLPIYDTMDAFFERHTADVAIISSPIHYHATQTISALQAGLHVLCEKPVCAGSEQAQSMLNAQKKSGKFVAIGYQWSYDPVILHAKSDVLAGLYGKPIAMRTKVLWPRDTAYYHRNNWAGKRAAADGTLIYDSVINNATAHYLHNMLFFLGDAIDQAALPQQLEAKLYRTRDIETFDTSFVKMRYEDKDSHGTDLWICTSHVTEKEYTPYLEYTYEKGTIICDDYHMRGVIGEKEIDYGHLDGGAGVNDKLNAILHAAMEETKLSCTIETALPHAKVIEFLQTQCEVDAYPAQRVHTQGEGEKLRYVIDGIDDEIQTLMQSMTLPE